MILVFLSPGPVLWAKSSAVENQIRIILRVLAYDQYLSTRIHQRGTGKLTIGVVYQMGNSDSQARAVDFLAALKDESQRTRIDQHTFEAVSIGFKDAADVKTQVVGASVSVMIICQGLLDKISDLSRLSQEEKILSFTTSREYVDRGISVGLVPGQGKSQIFVNLKSARAEGAHFDARFLRLTTVINGG